MATRVPNPGPTATEALDVRPDDHLTYLMAKVGHLLERRLDLALHHEGLTLRQFSALAHIGRTPGLSSAALARLLLTTPQAVGSLVQRLAVIGLLHRSPGAPGAPIALTLTSRGGEILQRAAAVATAAEADALAALPPKDLATTQATLRNLLSVLGDPQSARSSSLA